jgi:hypothetical protein
MPISSSCRKAPPVQTLLSIFSVPHQPESHPHIVMGKEKRDGEINVPSPRMIGNPRPHLDDPADQTLDRSAYIVPSLYSQTLSDKDIQNLPKHQVSNRWNLKTWPPHVTFSDSIFRKRPSTQKTARKRYEKLGRVLRSGRREFASFRKNKQDRSSYELRRINLFELPS